MKLMRLLVPLIAVLALCAQQPLEFEAASVKPNTAGGPGATSRTRNDAVEFENYSLRRLIQTAYRAKDYAYAGPSWLDSVFLDVVAKRPAGTKPNQVPEMLQTLLAQRFKLTVHRERREIDGLALVVDKKGLKIPAVTPGTNSNSWGPATVQGTSISMDEFADLLANALDGPVKNQTALPGVYDVRIKWLPNGPLPNDTGDMAGSPFAAVQQLGLKLEKQKVPIEVVVVDSAERSPIEN